MESTLPATYTDTLPTILRTVGDLDHVDRAAAARPLGLVVAATMQAAARSVHTRRAYTTGIGYFLTCWTRPRSGPSPGRLATLRPSTQGRTSYAGAL